ncbi:MAG: hypothetical protein LBF83_00800, partial [Spirochaetaceae bacterium]|nr:hypothetical protein [Spirochaetaceae bacterium]
VTIPLNFDANGNASYSYTKRCVGFTVSLSAYIDSCPADSKFDIHLHTNYSQDFSWTGIAPGAHSSRGKVLHKTYITNPSVKGLYRFVGLLAL